LSLTIVVEFPWNRLPKLTKEKLIEREAKKLGIQVRKWYVTVSVTHYHCCRGKKVIMDLDPDLVLNT